VICFVGLLQLRRLRHRCCVRRWRSRFLSPRVTRVPPTGPS
jgi:hypothetical protein